MMMTEIVDHKRKNYDNYFHGTAASAAMTTATAAAAAAATNYGSMSGKKLKTDAGGGPIYPKEKKDRIGERVAALQQLVSPFGKSDTASVLQEASGYIKFLHDQLKVLSAPYLRTSVAGKVEDGDYYSLGSRGLCLMPVAVTLGIARSNGADLWAPVNSSSRNP
ncbi:transcription factor bHLH113-like [Ananas comosus]|uniref:Transcription factor bHLH113 n=1 Tax=Ananas comosus TaxID=4615 RepID=A0A199ULW4_ANACO|nr:transcription factor bHLH113-like [Ananas comosus]OAY65738.1 Transcription factor bHLH113 [Ananas comosus]